MAMGAMPPSFSAINSTDSSLGFVTSSDFVRLSDLKKRTQYVRTKVSIIRNSKPSQDNIVELQHASQGSLLLGGVPGKIDLYVGKTVVKRGTAMEHATNALIELIKENGRWVEPPSEE